MLLCLTPKVNLTVVHFLVFGFSILSYIGISVFAISGALRGLQKKLDFFGVFLAAFLTAIGGGAIRDILIGQPPEFIHNVWYFVIVAGAVFITATFRELFVKSKFIVYMDAVGLGTFSILGASKGLQLGEPVQSIVMVGLLTGIGGGVVRDALLAEIPMVFKGELYATAAFLGIGLFLLLVKVFELPLELSMYISAGVTALIRSIAFASHLKVKPL